MSPGEYDIAPYETVLATTKNHIVGILHNGKGLFFCLLELEGGGGGIAAWRECGMFAVNGRPYITPF